MCSIVLCFFFLSLSFPGECSVSTEEILDEVLLESVPYITVVTNLCWSIESCVTLIFTTKCFLDDVHLKLPVSFICTFLFLFMLILL